MLEFHKHYLSNSRRDLISKSSSYKNINGLSKIDFLSLDFLKSKNSKSFAIRALCFFYFFLGFKGNVRLYSKPGLKKSIFCDLELVHRKDIFLFMEKYYYNILYKEAPERLLKSSLSNTGTFSFMIKDILDFVELEESIFRFRNLENFKVTFVFSTSKIAENLNLLRSLGFIF